MNTISRRNFLSRVPLATAAALILPKSIYSLTRSGRIDYVDVETVYGKLRGIRNEGVNIFKGVPYAGKVSGERRFRSPAPLKQWSGIRDALRLGPPSIQLPNQTYGIDEPDPAEDCLTLNIWMPANDNHKRPVMFYSHGGGFTAGSAGSVAQDGSNLAKNYDVVVVSTNHRLGLLGYLYLDEIAGEDYEGSGNRGILDIVAGLEWVHNNIEAFGGDPENVMIFGESGGGAKTSCLYAMPGAKAFFKKASIESGPGVRMTDRNVAIETTSMVLKELNIDPRDWRKLLDVTAADLLKVQVILQQRGNMSLQGGFKGIGASGPGGFGPVVDGKFLSAHPFDPVAPDISRNKPLIVGWNEDEYIFFAMYSKDMEAFSLDFNGLQTRLEKRFGENANRIIETYRKNRPEASATDIYMAIYSILAMGLGSITIAEKKAAQQAAPAYLYNFGYKSEVKVPGTDYAYGAMHALDINFKFDNIGPYTDKSGQQVYGMGGSRPERIAAARNMSEMWTTFARTGKPGAEGQPEWPAYTLPQRPTMRIDTKCGVINDRYREERQLWESLLKNV